MVGKTNFSAGNWLEYITGKTNMPAKPTAYIALLTAPATEAGTGYTECTIARLTTAAADWNSASGGPPRLIDNSAVFTFAAPTPVNPEAAIGWALFDAVTAGTMLFQDYLGAHPWQPFVCSHASPGVFTAPGHGLANGDKIVLTNQFGGTLPTTASSFAGVLTVAGVSGATFDVGVNSTAAGNGMFRKVTTYTIATGTGVTIAAGGCVIRDA